MAPTVNIAINSAEPFGVLPESAIEIHNFSGQDDCFWLSALITYQQQTG
jgi:hypothetical protein